MKEARRKLPFWRRRKLRSDWGKKVRADAPILVMAGELIAMYEPDYASEDDIADAPNAVIAPTDSDSEDSDNGSVPTEKRGGG